MRSLRIANRANAIRKPLSEGSAAGNPHGGNRHVLSGREGPGAGRPGGGGCECWRGLILTPAGGRRPARAWMEWGTIVSMPSVFTAGSVGFGLPGSSSAPFIDRVRAAMGRYGPLVFGLDPSGDLLTEWSLTDTPDGLERFVDIVVDASVGAVGVVKPQAAFYERHGWRGIRSLARLVESCRGAGLLVLLDAKRGDIGSTSQAYAEAYLGPDAGIPVDAITISPYLGLAAMQPILDRAVASDAGVFVVTRSSNAEGRALQSARHADTATVEQRLVADIAAENNRLAPRRVGPIGSVFGPTHGPPTDFDLHAMNGLFLAPGVGAQGATPATVAACFADCPDRVLASASRSLLAAGPDPSRLRDSAQTLAAHLRDALRT